MVQIANRKLRQLFLPCLFRRIFSPLGCSFCKWFRPSEQSLLDVIFHGLHIKTYPILSHNSVIFQPDWSKLPGLCPNQLESHPKASALLEGPYDVVMSLALLKSFLILWKQLEVLKEHWGRLKLRGQDVNSALLHKQVSELYE